MTDPVALAVDFGGTKVEAALVDDSGALIEASRRREPTGRDATSEQLEHAVRSVVARTLECRQEGREVIGVGIGCAGPVERRDGLVSPVNLPAWRDYPMRSLVASAVTDAIGENTLPVHLEMDGIAITMAEHWIGVGQGVDDMMGMVVSTGIGGGLILGGRVMTGPSGNAGHIGHIEVAGMLGEPTLGRLRSLEAIASGPHTVAWARTQGFVGARGEDLAAAHAAGDPVARAAVSRTGRAVGQAIASATALLDLELVAIGGGFSQVAPDLFDVIRQTIADHPFAFVRKVRVVPSGLSGEGPLIGAAALIHRAHLLH